jgi:hypothetical protein
VIAWTSDVSNRWSADWLGQGQSFSQFWAQVVKRSMRPAEDPNRQVSVALSGDQATISLQAQDDQHQYVNFLPTSANVVDPRGTPLEVQLPQIAPGQYQATLPAVSEGVYTLQVTETDGDGTQASQSSGFVVPYSPEYRDLSTNDRVLSDLAASTGGRVLDSADGVLAHDLPAVGAPRPIWPALLALLAVVLVADVGVRRLRLSAFEVRAGYRAARERLGYRDEVLSARRPAMAARPVPLVVSPTATPTTRHAPTPVAAPRSQQLLAAKRRATKH